MMPPKPRMEMIGRSSLNWSWRKLESWIWYGHDGKCYDVWGTENDIFQAEKEEGEETEI